MDTIVLDQIPFHIETAYLMKKLRMKPGHHMEQEVLSLAEEALPLGRPKAMCKVVYIDSKSEDGITVDGIAFTSRVLRVNLDQVHRIFPYVVTCGTELDEWANGIDDMLRHFWADTIKEMALLQAREALLDHLCETYRLGKTSAMAPGSLKDWPIQQQRPLFQLLGNVEETVGVRLTDSMLMIPNKSVSGIRFPTEVTFESCQLCPMDKCPNRRAVFDPDLYEEKYAH